MAGISCLGWPVRRQKVCRLAMFRGGMAMKTVGRKDMSGSGLGVKVLAAIAALSWSAVCVGDVADLLSKAKAGRLGPAEWKELSAALTDSREIKNWAAIADVMAANQASWDPQNLVRMLEARWLGAGAQLDKLPFATLDALWVVCKKLDCQAVSLKVALSWMKASDQWKTLGPPDSVELLEGILKQPSPEAERVRKSVAGALYQRYLDPDTVGRPATLPERTHILKNVAPLLSDAQKEQLQSTLSELFKDAKRVRDVSVYDFRDLRRHLTRMDAEEFFVVRCCGPWVVFSPNARKMSSRDRLWINERLERYAGRHSDLQVIEALAHSFAQTGEQRRAEHWVKEVIRLFAKAEDPVGSDAATMAAIARMLESMQLADRETDLRWRWAVLLRYVMDGPVNDRLARWRLSVKRLGKEGLPALSTRSLEDLKIVLGRLGKEGDLPPGRVLSDLVTLTDDELFAKPRLQELANRQALLQLSDSAPADVRALLKAGREAVRAGRVEAAINSYSAALKKPIDPGTSKAVRRVLLPLLLDRGLKHLAVAKDVFEALRPTEGPWPTDVWNGGLRLAFRDALTAEPDKRRAVWFEWMKVLSGGDGGLSLVTLDDLDGFTTALREGESLDPAVVLTDLVLCTSDLPSMRRVLQRRTQVLVTSKRWSEAVGSSALDVHLATLDKGGPHQACVCWRTAMAAAGAPEQVVRRLQSLSMPGGRSTHLGQSQPRGKAVWDERLQRAAQAMHQTSDAALTVRRRRWVRLFAGENETALMDFHSCLRSSGDGSRGAVAEMAAVCVALRLAEGDMSDGWRFCRQVATGDLTSSGVRSAAGLLTVLIRREGQLPTKRADEAVTSHVYGQLSLEGRARLAAEALLRQRQHMIQWGWQAAAAGDEQWAGRLWATALTLVDEQGVAPVLAEVFGRADGMSGAAMAGTLRAMANAVEDLSLKRQILSKLAKNLCDRRMYSESLVTLDKADALAATPEAKKNLDGGIIRVTCLIRLGRTEQGLELLKSLGSWSGTQEQHAQAAFLLGWMHLQSGRQDQALEVFGELVRKYPKSALAGKARQILVRLDPKG